MFKKFPLQDTEIDGLQDLQISKGFTGIFQPDHQNPPSIKSPTIKSLNK
jgi:hypothetical protein